jgi:hypothetical protein
MKISVLSIFLLSILALTSSVYGQTVPKAGIISDLSFIEGQWIANADGRSVEGSWLPPKKDNMVGFFRIINNDKPNVYEILLYEQAKEGTVSLVKHFNPGLTGQEELDKPVRHVCLESGKGRVLYEKDGEAVRILYEKKTDDRFVISVGKPENNTWVYKELFDFKRIK